MISLAVHHIVAQHIEVAPATIFDEIAERLPDGPTARLLRHFGHRQDITAKAFGWQLIHTPDGPDFMPAAEYY